MVFKLLHRHGRRLRRDERGVSAIEFALIAPIMILFYFGLAEVTQVMMAQRKAIRTASAVGDIVAQRPAIKITGPGGINDVFDMAETLMTPYPTATQLKICLASIVANAAGVKTVSWSRAKNGATCPAAGATIANADLPPNIIGANESAIMSRVTYSYSGPTNMVIKANPTFTKTFYLRPRSSSVVTCSDC